MLCTHSLLPRKFIEHPENERDKQHNLNFWIWITHIARQKKILKLPEKYSGTIPVCDRDNNGSLTKAMSIIHSSVLNWITKLETGSSKYLSQEKQYTFYLDLMKPKPIKK